MHSIVWSSIKIYPYFFFFDLWTILKENLVFIISKVTKVSPVPCSVMQILTHEVSVNTHALTQPSNLHAEPAVKILMDEL